MTAAPIAAAHSVAIITPADEARAMAVLALAFSTDPVARWIWPDSNVYLTNSPTFTRAFAGEAFKQGTAYQVGDLCGTALWLAPGAHSDEEAMVALLERTVANKDREDVYAFLDQMSTYHPRESHWYLPMIGVDPRFQGQGYGSALLRHALEVCDRDRLPAYLESSNLANVPLYQRHGFEVIGTIQAGASPTMYPMLRLPR